MHKGKSYSPFNLYGPSVPSIVAPRRVFAAMSSLSSFVLALLLSVMASGQSSLPAAPQTDEIASGTLHLKASCGSPRALAAVSKITVPVLLIHTANDCSVTPGKSMAAEFARLSKLCELKLYPPVGQTASDGHNFPYTTSRYGRRMSSDFSNRMSGIDVAKLLLSIPCRRELLATDFTEAVPRCRHCGSDQYRQALCAANDRSAAARTNQGAAGSGLC
jgi:hypothetical protein